MNSKLLSFFSSAGLLSAIMLVSSCSPMFGDGFMRSDSQRNQLPMAEARGINAKLMDDRLVSLMEQTQSIESQVIVLLKKLSDMRHEINAYEQMGVEESVAENEPQSLIQPNKQVETQSMRRKNKNVVMAKPIEKKQATQKTMAKPKPAVKKVTINKTTKPKPSMVSAKGVYNIRLGKHTDKTRVVFDISGSTKHEMNFDKDAELLTITMPDTKWSTSQSKVYSGNQFVGYEAKTTEKGTIIAMAVKNTKNAKILTLSNPSRLVVDLIK